jgi:hypothetical protein
MFKYSGTMRLLADKEFLLSIWDVYDGFSLLKDLLEWDFQMKSNDIRKEISIVVENDMKMTGIPMYSYYVFGVPQSAQKTCEDLLNEAKELVSKLEERFK